MRSSWARRSPGMGIFYRIVLFVSWLFAKVLYRHRVYGTDRYYVGGAILAANHTSFLDPPLISISWPEEVHFLARQTLFDVPVLGTAISALNTHPVRGGAGDAALFKYVIKLLKEKKKVILFPEGTRSDGEEMGPIKPGLSLLIEKADAAIIPAYIHGAYAIWNRKKKFPKLWGKTACVFGSPIFWHQFGHLPRKEAHEALTNALAHAISALRSWYLAGAKGSPP